MPTSLLIYVLFSISIILQIVTLLLVSNRLKSIEELNNKTKIVLREEIAHRLSEILILNSTSDSKNLIQAAGKTALATDAQVPAKDNLQDLVKDNLEEDVIFMKQIKLNRGSQVIDMDVQVNNKN